MRPLLKAALDLAAREFAVFPCIPGQREPATRRGFYDATTNPAVIRRWWTARAYNIGIRTGVASGMWALDVDVKDGKDGEANLRKLEREHGDLPPTIENITGSGGRHICFKYTGPISNSTGKIAPGLDVRGDGGYIIAPPSLHPCGRAYVQSVDSADALAVAPDWLLQLARKPKPTISEQALANLRARREPVSPGSYGKAALEYETTALANTPLGQRNHALNRASFSLFQLVAGGELNEADVVNKLLEAANANGLMTDPHDGPRKVTKTINSGARAGLQHPRSRRSGP